MKFVEETELKVRSRKNITRPPKWPLILELEERLDKHLEVKLQRIWKPRVFSELYYFGFKIKFLRKVVKNLFIKFEFQAVLGENLCLLLPHPCWNWPFMRGCGTDHLLKAILFKATCTYSRCSKICVVTLLRFLRPICKGCYVSDITTQFLLKRSEQNFRSS